MSDFRETPILYAFVAVTILIKKQTSIQEQKTPTCLVFSLHSIVIFGSRSRAPENA